MVRGCVSRKRRRQRVFWRIARRGSEASRMPFAAADLGDISVAPPFRPSRVREGDEREPQLFRCRSSPALRADANGCSRP